MKPSAIRPPRFSAILAGPIRLSRFFERGEKFAWRGDGERIGLDRFRHLICGQWGRFGGEGE
jgi:hypothetical protein